VIVLRRRGQRSWRPLDDMMRPQLVRAVTVLFDEGAERISVRLRSGDRLVFRLAPPPGPPVRPHPRWPR
jgi:hypothetical protein